MTPEQESIVRKIQKLLALSERAGSDYEAASAAAQARKIMQEYDLSMTDVESITSGDCKEQAITMKESYFSSHCKLLQSAICEGYEVDSFSQYTWRNGRRTVLVVFVGIMPDVIIAAQLFSFLDGYVRRKTRQHKFTGKSAAAYKFAFCTSVYRRLKQSIQMDTSQENALVLVKNAAVKNYMQQKHSNLKPGKPANAAYDGAASSLGYAEGNAVSLDRPVESTGKLALNIS